MGTKVVVSEKYWDWGSFSYKYREKTKWRFYFSELRVHYWGLWSWNRGKEDNIWYHWTEGCFNMFGTKTYWNVEKLFDSPPDRD